MWLVNNYQFEFKSTLTTSGTTVNISVELENDAVATFTDQYIEARRDDDSVVERMKGTAAAGVLTLSKRGLDQSDTDVEVPAYKREWREGTKCFVTIVSSQLANFVDKTVPTQSIQEAKTYATTVARDTALGANGVATKAYVDIYVTGGPGWGLFYRYNLSTWQWEAYTTGTTTPIATEASVGTAELGNLAEQLAHTETGSTWPLVMQTKNTANDHYIYTPAFLTGGTSATTVVATWNAVTNGTFNITINGVARSVTWLNFSTDTTTAQIASRIQTAIRALTSSTETVVFSTNQFIISSVNTTLSSAITVTSAQGTGTDISWVGGTAFLDAETGRGTVTNAVFNTAAHGGMAVVLSSDGKVAPNLLRQTQYFGDGSDGDVVINSNTTLTRDMFYRNLTINATFTLSPAWYRIHCTGRLLNNGTIARGGNVGGAASWSTGWSWAAALPNGTLWDSSVTGWAGASGGGTVNWNPWVSQTISYTATSGVAGGAGAGGGAPAGTGWVWWTSVQWSLYNLILSREAILSALQNPASSTLYWGATPYRMSGGAWGGWAWWYNTLWAGNGWGGWWGGGIWWLIYIAAYILENNWVISSVWWVGWAWASWPAGNAWAGWGWGWGNGWVVLLIYTVLSNLWTVTLTGGAGGAAGVWGGPWAAGTAGNTGTTIQVIV